MVKVHISPVILGSKRIYQLYVSNYVTMYCFFFSFYKNHPENDLHKKYKEIPYLFSLNSVLSQVLSQKK